MESQLDFAAGTYGKVSNVIVHFTRITGGDDTGKWTATVRLLGVTESRAKPWSEDVPHTRSCVWSVYFRKVRMRRSLRAVNGW